MTKEEQSVSSTWGNNSLQWIQSRLQSIVERVSPGTTPATGEQWTNQPPSGFADMQQLKRGMRTHSNLTRVRHDSPRSKDHQSDKARPQDLAQVTDNQSTEEMDHCFVALISHELRTPLAAISMTLTLCEDGAFGDLDENGKERLKKARTSSRRLLSLINDLVDFHRLGAGKFKLRIATVELQDILEVALSEVAPLSEARSLNVTLSCDPCTIEADPDKLEQVLINLLANAIKFSPRGSSITVEGRVEGDNVIVRVKDSGSGIPAELSQRLFGAYEQAMSGHGGTGLGLFICKSIVEQHHGTIGVESESENGSTFWFRLPISSPLNHQDPL